MPETYNEDAVQQILKLAMVRQGQDVALPRSQLVEIAEDLGITESTLAAAEEEWQSQQEEQQAREEFELYRHHQLRQSIVRFIAVDGVLVLLNLVFAHRINWAVYPTLIWGMAIALQAWQTYQKEGEEYDRAFRRWRLRQQIGESFKAISERFKILGNGDGSGSSMAAGLSREGTGSLKSPSNGQPSNGQSKGQTNGLSSKPSNSPPNGPSNNSSKGQGRPSISATDARSVTDLRNNPVTPESAMANGFPAEHNSGGDSDGDSDGDE